MHIKKNRCVETYCDLQGVDKSLSKLVCGQDQLVSSVLEGVILSLLYSLHPLLPSSLFCSFLRPLSPRRRLPLCHHFLTLILQRLNPTLSLLKSICQVSVHLTLAHCLVFSCLPLSSTLLFFPLSVNPTCSPLYCTSHVSLSLCTWLSLVKPKGRGGLTLIDASDRGEEREMALGWQG